MRALFVAALLYLFTSPAAAQTAGDSTVTVNPDRYVIDAARRVRETGARSLADLLAGQVPGLLVIPGSGLNGGGARIRFAGPRSLVDNVAPLFVVDGIRVDAAEDATLVLLGGPGPLRLDDLSVEDVESIEILRGGASVAAYGPAANGVILIRTKRGRSGPARFETYARGAVETVPSRWPANYGGVDPFNANPDYRNGLCSLTEQAEGHCVQDHVQSFNPLVQRSPFATVLRRQVGFIGSGGPRWGAFRVGGSFDGDGGPYEVAGVAPDANSYRRWSLRGSGIVRPLPTLEIGVTAAHVSSDLRLPTYLPVQAALFGSSDSAGFAWDPLFALPVTQAVERTLGVLDVRWSPLPWLSLHGLTGVDDVHQGEGAVDPGLYRFEGHRETRRWTSALNAAFNYRLWPRVRLVTTIGVEHGGSRLAEGWRQGPDSTPFCGPTSPCSGQSLTLSEPSWWMHVTQQVNIRERLFVTGALRHDKLDGYPRRITDPSVTVTWVARPKTPRSPSPLQLRAGYGSASRPHALPFHIFFLPPLPPEALLRPERTRSFELGAEAWLLGARWHGDARYYDMRSDVISYSLAMSGGGFAATYGMGAQIGNRGVEGTLAGTVLNGTAVGWDVRLSVWGNRNRVLTHNVPPGFFSGAGTPVQMLLAGYPVGSYWTRPIQSYADANGDGVIVPTEVVLNPTFVWVGTPYPTHGAGLTSAWRLGSRWRVSAGLDYRAGHTLFNQTAWFRCRRIFATCRERHDPQTSLADQAIAVAATLTVPAEYFEDADYLKLRELAVSVDLPPGVAAALGSRAGTITVAGRNLVTWTGYSGPDPEAGSYNVPIAGQPQGVADFGTLPPLRSWTLRVQLAY